MAFGQAVVFVSWKCYHLEPEQWEGTPTSVCLSILLIMGSCVNMRHLPIFPQVLLCHTVPVSSSRAQFAVQDNGVGKPAKPSGPEVFSLDPQAPVRAGTLGNRAEGVTVPAHSGSLPSKGTHPLREPLPHTQLLLALSFRAMVYWSV